MSSEYPLPLGGPRHSLDLTQPFLTLQVTRAKAGGCGGIDTRANGEWLPFKNISVDLVIDNENMADMTPVKLTREELLTGTGTTPQHQEALDWIRRVRLPLGQDLPKNVIFNLGPFRCVAELWRVLKPGGRAFFLPNLESMKADRRRSSCQATQNTKSNTATCVWPSAGWAFKNAISHCLSSSPSNRTPKCSAPARPIPFSGSARL